jgi:hypothetical protein
MAEEDFYLTTLRNQAEALETQLAAARADAAAHKQNGDYQSGSYTAQQIANLRQEQRNLYALYDEYAASQRAPQQPYVSPETRAARGPNEMDTQDLANLMNESRYSKLGNCKSFTAQDYYNLRHGLPSYYASRGREQK